MAIAFFGMTMERYLPRGLEGQNLRQMLMTMGIALFFQDLLLVIFEGYPLEPDSSCLLYAGTSSGHFPSMCSALHDRSRSHRSTSSSGGFRKRPGPGPF